MASQPLPRKIFLFLVATKVERVSPFAATTDGDLAGRKRANHTASFDKRRQLGHGHGLMRGDTYPICMVWV